MNWSSREWAAANSSRVSSTDCVAVTLAAGAEVLARVVALGEPARLEVGALLGDALVHLAQDDLVLDDALSEASDTQQV